MMLGHDARDRKGTTMSTTYQQILGLQLKLIFLARVQGCGKGVYPKPYTLNPKLYSLRSLNPKPTLNPKP